MANTKHEVRTEFAWPNAPLSQAIVAGSMIFVSGQGPRDPVTKTVPDGLAAQTRQVLENVKGILETAGSNMDEVVKVTVHLDDISQRDAFNEVYLQYFTPPYPARTAVGSQMNGILVEVDVIAVKAG